MCCLLTYLQKPISYLHRCSTDTESWNSLEFCAPLATEKGPELCWGCSQVWVSCTIPQWERSWFSGHEVLDVRESTWLESISTPQFWKITFSFWPNLNMPLIALIFYFRFWGVFMVIFYPPDLFIIYSSREGRKQPITECLLSAAAEKEGNNQSLNVWRPPSSP